MIFSNPVINAHQEKLIVINFRKNIRKMVDKSREAGKRNRR